MVSVESFFETVIVKITSVYLLATSMATLYVLVSVECSVTVFLPEPSKCITSTTALIVKYILPVDASTARPRTTASGE